MKKIIASEIENRLVRTRPKTMVRRAEQMCGCVKQSLICGRVSRVTSLVFGPYSKIDIK